MERNSDDSSLEENQIISHAIYQVFIGSMHPSLKFQEIVNDLVSKGFTVNLNRSKSRINKRFCILRVSSEKQYKYLTSPKGRIQFIKGQRIEIEKYLTGNSKSKRDEKIGRKKLYVGNLPNNSTSAELAKFFSTYGNVKAAYIKAQPQKRKKNNFKYGFVEFFKESVANQVLKLKKIKFKTKNIFIREFKSNRLESSDGPRKDETGKHVTKINDKEGVLKHDSKSSFTEKKFPARMVNFFSKERNRSPIKLEVLLAIHQRHFSDQIVFQKNKKIEDKFKENQ